jgi:hypothetical protein
MKSKGEFEYLTAVILKSIVVWDVTPCRSESPTFRRNISSPLSERKSKPIKKPAEVADKLSHRRFGVTSPPSKKPAEAGAR